MKQLSCDEFERRWREASKQPAKIRANIKPRKVDLSMSTILGRYERVVRKAEAEHRIDAKTCEEVIQKTEQLRKAVARMDEQQLQDLKP